MDIEEVRITVLQKIETYRRRHPQGQMPTMIFIDDQTFTEIMVSAKLRESEIWSGNLLGLPIYRVARARLYSGPVNRVIEVA